ncbi:MAG: YdeI/OmpD-associated family protein [Betaproteobacteria bacterium]|nr:YdeI/OmpD-associated family protein [Betaproteobacteria bacterium]
MSASKVDAYIAKSAPFAQPILTEIRARVRKACPEAEEAIKWRMPSFQYKGKILCGMAAFKQHAAFGFWRREVAGGTASEHDAMGQFGKLTDVKQLPTKTEFARMVKAAMALIDSNAATTSATRKHPRPTLTLPDDFAAAMKKNKAATKTFDGFSPTHQRDYIEWIIEAKRAETRVKRIAQAVEWLAEGKTRHWKYQNC